MKKRLMHFTLAFCIIISMTIPVMAKLSEDDMAVVSGYAMDGELYMFAQLDSKYTGAGLDTKVTVDGITITNKTSPVAIGDSEAVIKYLLLIDQSGSMKQYIDKVNAFVDALADHERAQAVFSIAGFGEDFQVISQDITDKEAVKSAIAGLSYQEPWTDPYNAVVKALNHIDTAPRTRGEVLNMIVISDGDADLGIKDAEEAMREEQGRAAAAKDKIQNSPEVLIHTFGVSQWEELCLDTYEAGRGCNAVIEGENDAAAYGEKIANYIDSLYFLDFSLQRDVGAKRFTAEVQMNGQDVDGNPAIMNTTLENIPNLTNYIVEESEEDIFKIIGSAQESKEDDSKTLISDTEAFGKDGENDGWEDGKDTDHPGDGLTEETDNNQSTILLPILLAVTGTCLVLIVVLAFLLVRKNRGGGKITSDTGILMWLEALSGELKTPQGSFCISGSMVIGSDAKADIVLKADGVCSAHARLFVSNGVVYMEDISGNFGVFIGGMRLQAPNRLRDGDEAVLGSARVRIRIP